MDGLDLANPIDARISEPLEDLPSMENEVGRARPLRAAMSDDALAAGRARFSGTLLAPPKFQEGNISIMGLNHAPFR